MIRSDTPIWQLTVSEFMQVLENCMPKNDTRKEEHTAKKYVYGLKGLWCSSNASSASTMILRPICVTALSITPLSFILIAVPLEQENNSHRPFSQNA